MPRLEVLVGMIGSGKSTYARRRARQGAIVVCQDDLTAALHAEYRYEPGLRPFYRGVEESIALDALRLGRDVVVDRTHLTVESRNRWVWFIATQSLSINLDCIPIAVEFPREDAYAHAMRRYENDPRGRPFHEWFRVALHHQDQADREPLTSGEGFDRIIQWEGVRNVQKIHVQ